MVDWHLGTVGYSYKDWDGVFYPAGLNPRGYLSHYSQVFDTVELDTTFYGPPDLNRVQRWSHSVPDDFTFCPKTPRHITHDLLLKNADMPMRAFIDAVRPFGARLGPILIQLPPNFDATQAPLLERFLGELPRDLRFAVEFRHVSWYAGPAAFILKKHGMAWVSQEYPGMPQQVNLTADFLYFRWMGKHGQYVGKTHEREDKTARLRWWYEQMRPHLGEIRAVYGFMNNDYAGYSPGSMNRFKTVAGLPVRIPEVYQQQRLL